MEFKLIAANFLSPPVLFFLLGIIAVLVRSDLKMPEGAAKFLTLYLLFDIGIKGGQELNHSGLSTDILLILFACVLLSAAIPYFAYKILRFKLNEYDAGAIAAAYGSVSAVTFATAVAFLQLFGVKFGGYMVAAMALMESPAIISGLILINVYIHKEEPGYTFDTYSSETLDKSKFKKVIHEAVTNGSVLLLIGSLLIGFVAGDQGHTDLKPFVNDIFKGVLCLYLLNMGIVAGSRLNDLRKSGIFLLAFSIVFPILCGAVGIGVSYLLHLSLGDALLMTILCGSASYIAVPAAMQMAVPQANMSILIPMTLGITFPFNIIIGIPLYFQTIKYFFA